jgi:hypothetical protein
MTDEPEELRAEALCAEFDRLMTARGISVPASHRAGAIAVYADLKRQTQLLRGPMTAASEPASIFCLRSILRGKE